jgi:hypothetical protein
MRRANGSDRPIEVAVLSHKRAYNSPTLRLGQLYALFK